MAAGENDVVLRIEEDGLLSERGHERRLPVLAPGMLDDGEDDGIDIQPPVLGGSCLPRARALLPELERRRRGHEDALIDLRHARREAAPEGWRLRIGPYLALMLTAGLLLTAGTHASIRSFEPGMAGVAAAVGFALNITGLAHLAGGWARGIAGMRSWRRRMLIALFTIAASFEISTLIWMAGMGWAEPRPLTLGAMAGGAVVAIIVSALHAQPNADLARLLRREAGARRDYDSVRRQMLAETAAVRARFEEEARALEAAAAPLNRGGAQ